MGRFLGVGRPGDFHLWYRDLIALLVICVEVGYEVLVVGAEGRIGWGVDLTGTGHSAEK